VPMDLSILPIPQELKPAARGFSITRDTPIILSTSCDDADYRAASILREHIEHRSSIEVKIEKHATDVGLGGHILFARLDDIGGVAGASFSPVKGAGSLKRIGDEGYVISVTPERTVVAAASSAGIYYGVQTLRQVIDGRPARASFPGMLLTDWPSFRYRGVMLDVSRGKVPTNDTIKELVELLGVLKINVLQLYVEHTFAFHRHPVIAHGSGALTHEDLVKIQQHAKLHHVEVQANLQSFGHMERILSLEAYQKLAESDRRWSLSPSDPATYAFLESLYSEYLPCFESKLFNADCDETYDLGKGRSAKRAERIGVGMLYLEHIKAIRALAHKFGKRLLIWGDIVLQHPAVIGKIPKDVVMLNWGYGARHDFASTAKFRRAKLEHWVCPGSNSWSALFPRLEVACRNISGFAAAGLKSGATGLLNTDWGDGGHPNLLGCSYHAFAFGAEASWSGARRHPASFDDRFSWTLFHNRTGIVGKIFRMLAQTNAAFGETNDVSVPFKVYWAEFPYGPELRGLGAAALNRCERTARTARAQISVARQILQQQRMLLDELDFCARQTILACTKARLAATIVKAVPRSAGVSAAGFGGRGVPPTIVAEVADVLREWKLQRDEFERLWMARARRSEIETRLRLYRDREQELARLAAPAMRRPELT
jgi:hexosaminidase